jgi:GAF domain-containing protein
MVLARDGPVIASEPFINSLPDGPSPILRLLDAGFFASVPVRSLDGKILGALTVFSREPRRGLAADELHMLESLADMAASLLELRRLRKSLSGDGLHPPQETGVRGAWPSEKDLRHALDEH